MDPNDAMADEGGDAFPRCPLVACRHPAPKDKATYVGDGRRPDQGRHRPAVRRALGRRQWRAIQKEVANSYASEIAI